MTGNHSGKDKIPLAKLKIHRLKETREVWNQKSTLHATAFHDSAKTKDNACMSPWISRMAYQRTP